MTLCMRVSVRHNGKWGALGLSRKNTLMDKDLVYDVRESPAHCHQYYNTTSTQIAPAHCSRCRCSSATTSSPTRAPGIPSSRHLGHPPPTHTRGFCKAARHTLPSSPKQIYVGFPFSHEVFSSVRAQPCIDCLAMARRHRRPR